MRDVFIEFNQAVERNSSCLSTALSTVAVHKSGGLKRSKMIPIAFSKHRPKSMLVQELASVVRMFSTA